MRGLANSRGIQNYNIDFAYVVAPSLRAAYIVIQRPSALQVFWFGRAGRILSV